MAMIEYPIYRRYMLLEASVPFSVYVDNDPLDLNPGRYQFDTREISRILIEDTAEVQWSPVSMGFLTSIDGLPVSVQNPYVDQRWTKYPKAVAKTTGGTFTVETLVGHQSDIILIGASVSGGVLNLDIDGVRTRIASDTTSGVVTPSGMLLRLKYTDQFYISTPNNWSFTYYDI